MSNDKILFLNMFQDFVLSDLRNVWIEVNGFKMYTRKSIRYFENQYINCLDIANIEARITGTGLFTTILTELLERYVTKHFFVESILNPRLPEFFKKYGFVQYRDNDMILVRKPIKDIIIPFLK